MRDGFIFYRSFFEGIQLLPEAERLKAYEALADYALNDREPAEVGMFSIVFQMAKPQIDANKKRQDAGKKGGRPKKETTGFEEKKPMVLKEETTGFEVEEPKYKYKYKDKDKKENIEKKSVKRFSPPTKEEVKAYCIKAGINIDIDRFIDFYESKDWMVGKNKMKSWEAAARNWSRGDKKPANAFHNFKQRDDNLDDLAAKLDNQFMEGKW